MASQLISGRWKGKDALFVLLGDSISALMLEGKELQMDTVKVFPVQLTTTFAHNPTTNTFVVVDVKKNLHVVKHSPTEEKSWVIPLPKNIMCAAFSEDGNSLYLGDRFGDVYRVLLKLDDGQITKFPVELISGCVSMITDILPLGRHILYADRDEKVRMIDEKKPFIIDRFFLGHSSYIAFIRALLGGRFISVGGDGKLIVWDVETGKALQTFHLDGQDDDLDISSVIAATNFVYVAARSPAKIFVFRIENDGSLHQQDTIVEIHDCQQILAIGNLDNSKILALGTGANTENFMVWPITNDSTIRANNATITSNDSTIIVNMPHALELKYDAANDATMVNSSLLRKKRKLSGGDSGQHAEDFEA